MNPKGPRTSVESPWHLANKPKFGFSRFYLKDRIAPDHVLFRRSNPTRFSRVKAKMEAVIGQLYFAVVVPRVIGLHIVNRRNNLPR